MTIERRGGRECRTCHWFAPDTAEMKRRYFPHAGTCELRFPWTGNTNGASTSGNALHGYDRGKNLDSWCSFWLPNLTTM